MQWLSAKKWIFLVGEIFVIDFVAKEEQKDKLPDPNTEMLISFAMPLLLFFPLSFCSPFPPCVSPTALLAAHTCEHNTGEIGLLCWDHQHINLVEICNKKVQIIQTFNSSMENHTFLINILAFFFKNYVKQPPVHIN